MALNNVPSGKSLPDDFNVIIEITAHSEPVKYEVDKESGAIFVDRFMSTSMHYPCNYGYIPHTIAGDGDPGDVLVVWMRISAKMISDFGERDQGRKVLLRVQKIVV